MKTNRKLTLQICVVWGEGGGGKLLGEPGATGFHRRLLPSPPLVHPSWHSVQPLSGACIVCSGMKNRVGVAALLAGVGIPQQKTLAGSGCSGAYEFKAYLLHQQVSCPSGRATGFFSAKSLRRDSLLKLT